MSPEAKEKAMVATLKFRSYVAIGWGLVILFAMMGVMLGRPQGVYIALIASVMWVQIRIVREALDGLMLLRGIKAAQSGEDDDKSPPGPPAAP